MRLFFHGLLSIAIAIVGTGIVCGTVTRARAAGEGAEAHAPSHPAAATRALAQARIPAPVPVLPRYGDRVSPGTTLAWVLGGDSDGARLEISRSLAFEGSGTRHVDVDGERFRLPDDLAGGVWYWRLRGRQKGLVGDPVTPTWMLFVASPQGEWG